jgi:hypothetical protein
MTAKQHRIYEEIRKRFAAIYGFNIITDKQDILFKKLVDYVCQDFKPKREKDYQMEEIPKEILMSNNNLLDKDVDSFKEQFNNQVINNPISVPIAKKRGRPKKIVDNK